jgi:hypothetical protein
MLAASVRVDDLSAAPGGSVGGAGTTLYNGIRLADPWPPRRRSLADMPIAPPYLVDRPAVVPIDLGRQLFVDDFLIEESSLVLVELDLPSAETQRAGHGGLLFGLQFDRRRATIVE